MEFNKPNFMIFTIEKHIFLLLHFSFYFIYYGIEFMNLLKEQELPTGRSYSHFVHTYT